MKITLNDVRAAQPKWFSGGNVTFFGDKSYHLMYGNDDKPYLVRFTSAWTDMFGCKKRFHYRINEIGPDLIIGDLFDDEFADMSEVEEWLAERSELCA